MESHEDLLVWANSKGVKLNGFQPQRIPGRGIGIVATRAIKPDEELLEVPTACLRTIDTVPKRISRRLPKDIPVHGLLAADLALDKSKAYAAWNAVCPTLADLSTVPLLWPPALQALLPPPAAKLLAAQQAKIARDWAAVSAAFGGSVRDGNDQDQAAKPAVVWESYRHAWLLVNTRTFYWDVSPRLKRRSKDDHMVLQPVADLFNHASSGGCHVSFDARGFTVAARRAYAPGEELYISYGSHSGDFLLVEYGFVMPGNEWDEVGIEAVVLAWLDRAAGTPAAARKLRDRLAGAGFLGGYALDAGAVCHRTQVAVRAACLGVREWKRFVDGEDDGERSQAKVDQLLVQMLEGYLQEVTGTMDQVQRIDAGLVEQRNMLLERWKHIAVLVKGTIERLKSPS